MFRLDVLGVLCEVIMVFGSYSVLGLFVCWLIVCVL